MGLPDNTASKTPKNAEEQDIVIGGTTAAAPQPVLIAKTAEGLHHAYDKYLIDTYFPSLNKDTLEKLLTLGDLNDDDQRALRDTFEPEQIVRNLDPYYLANAMNLPTLCERAMNHDLIEKNKSGVMINPWRTNTSMRGYGPEDRTLLEYDRETNETVISEYGEQIATQIQDIFVLGSICTSPKCKSTAQQHNPTKLHFGYSNEKDIKAPRTLYFVDCKTGACRDKLLRIVICRTVVTYEEHLQRLEAVSSRERVEALAQLVARQATMQLTQTVLQATPTIPSLTLVDLEEPVAGVKPRQQNTKKKRKRTNDQNDLQHSNQTVLRDTSLQMLETATKKTKGLTEQLVQLGSQASSVIPTRRTRSLARTESQQLAEDASSLNLLDEDSGDATDPQ
jgi:hypothetical protein